MENNKNPKPRRLAPSKGNVIALIVLLCIICTGVALLTVLSNREQPPPVSSETLSEVLSAPVFSAPEETLPTAAPVESESLAVATEPPQALQMPEGGWPALNFDPDELVALDEMLRSWAESVPAAVQEVEDSSAYEDDDPASSQAESGTDEPHGQRVAVYFKDLDSGAEYVYCADEKFPIASLSKASYVVYLYGLIEQGECSLEQTFRITKKDAEESIENSGVIKNDPDLPRDFTTEELIEVMLQKSDTLALRTLLKEYPASGYAQWAAGLGLAYPEDAQSVLSGKICAIDAGVYLAALYQYMEQGTYGLQLKDHLYRAGYPLIRSDYPVAHKYGWDSGAYHDMAVVYAPHPYLLAVLTDKSAGDWSDHAMFAQVTAALEQVMNSKWDQALAGLEPV